MLEVIPLDVTLTADEGSCRWKVCDSWLHVPNGARRLFGSCCEAGEGHDDAVGGEEEKTFSPRVAAREEGGVFCTDVDTDHRNRSTL